MEKLLSDLDMKNLVQELSHGRELAKQLHIHLTESSPRESSTGEVLLGQIANSFDHALSLLRHSGVGAAVAADPAPESLMTGSPDDSDHESSKDQGINMKKKWRTKMEVCGETELGQLDDGYGWRKYGQKEILGAKHPRGYYRCTYRYGKGCLATKQIQRSNHDPNIFDITYRGIHTCDTVGNCSPNNPAIPIINPHNQLETVLPLTENDHQSQVLSQNQAQPYFNIQTSLKVIPQDLDTSFVPSSSNMNPQNTHFFLDGNRFSDNNLSNFTIDDHGGFFDSFQNSESKTSNVIATSTTSLSDPPSIDPFDISYEFGSNFSFEDPIYFPENRKY